MSSAGSACRCLANTLRLGALTGRQHKQRTCDSSLRGRRNWRLSWPARTFTRSRPAGSDQACMCLVKRGAGEREPTSTRAGQQPAAGWVPAAGRAEKLLRAPLPEKLLPGPAAGKPDSCCFAPAGLELAVSSSIELAAGTQILHCMSIRVLMVVDDWQFARAVAPKRAQSTEGFRAIVDAICSAAAIRKQLRRRQRGRHGGGHSGSIHAGQAAAAAGYAQKQNHAEPKQPAAAAAPPRPQMPGQQRQLAVPPCLPARDSQSGHCQQVVQVTSWLRSPNSDELRGPQSADWQLAQGHTPHPLQAALWRCSRQAHAAPALLLGAQLGPGGCSASAQPAGSRECDPEPTAALGRAEARRSNPAWKASLPAGCLHSLLTSEALAALG